MTEYWNELRMGIWRRMTPGERDFDRYQGQFPPGHGMCETQGGLEAIAQRAEDRARDRPTHECSCHMNPPCWHCTDCEECADE